MRLNLPDGTFHSSTPLTEATQESEIVHDDVVGPLLAVLPLDRAHNGLDQADDLASGVAASAWIRDLCHAGGDCREVRSGYV